MLTVTQQEVSVLFNDAKYFIETNFISEVDGCFSQNNAILCNKKKIFNFGTGHPVASNKYYKITCCVELHIQACIRKVFNFYCFRI